MKTITINTKWCKSCGICSTFCPKNVFELDEQKHPVPARAQDCIGCMLCELRCPDLAIKVEG